MEKAGLDDAQTGIKIAGSHSQLPVLFVLTV